jgi:small subunit ribosomal protein S9
MKEKKQKDMFGVGRRKSAVAQVKVIKKNKDKLVNKKKFEEYFTTVNERQAALSPLEITSSSEKFGMIVKVRGGGKRAQADAVKQGLARALLVADPDWRTQFKAAGMLTRDARVKERKKPGLKGARRAPQFSKR